MSHTWEKPSRPKWMDQATYDSLPVTLALREVRGKVEMPGCRVKELVIVTTLLDDDTYSIEDILELYHERWHAELDLRSIKVQMKMDPMRCRTPEMVRKEIWAHLLAYNLVRKVMAQAAREHNTKPRHLSFAGAMQILNEFRALLLSSAAADLPALAKKILAAIARHRVGNRPDRCEPRKIKRRWKTYGLLKKPRTEEREALLK